jgi:hypothetical protein
MGRPATKVRRAALIAALALGLIALLALARPARAGTYVAVQCHPDYDLAAANAVFSRTSDHYVPASACAGSGQGLQITNNADATKDGRYGAWSWYPPAGTEFTHITSEAQVSHDSGHKGLVTIIDAAGNVHWRWPAEGSWQPVEWSAGSSAVAYTAWLQCYGAGGNCGRSGVAHSRVRRLWFTLADRSAPTLSLGGSLFEPGPRRGPQGAQLAATDAGGGVWRWRLLVNGSSAASAEAGCDIVPGGPARRFAPCPPSATHAFALDTEAAPFRHGANAVTACVSDVGWPANEVCHTRQVSVDNACRSSGNAAPTAIEASFANGRSVATAPSNRRLAIRGALSGRGDAHLSDASVCVFAEPVTGGGERHEGTARTDDAGRFRYSPPRGPSRRLRLVHRHGSEQVERTLTLRVRARPRLKVGPRSRLRNGQVAHFRGKLPGPAASGRVVVLQARVGGRWQAFESARSGPEGRFVARYRFRETTGHRLYRFRAVVREQAGYPYLKGASPVRRVVVSG